MESEIQLNDHNKQEYPPMQGVFLHYKHTG